MNQTSRLLALLLAAFAMPASAQYSIDWYKVTGGGGTSTSAVYTVTATIGQPDAGHAASANYSVDGGYWGLIAAVQMPGLPYLSIAGTTTNTVLVYWPAGGPSCVLLESATMATNSWTTVGSQPLHAGNTMQVIVSPPLGKKFYHLSKP